MVNLRIQELAEAKGITLKELSQISGISEEVLKAYATKPVEIEKASDDIKKIAAKLNVPVIDLIKNVAKKLAFKLDILKVMQQKRISLETLISSSKIHPAVLLFYITQPISNDMLAKSPYQDHLKNISDALKVSPEDLKVVSDLPKTRFDIEESLKEKGLTVEEWSNLMGWPIEFIRLMATQPVDISAFIEITSNFVSLTATQPVNISAFPQITSALDRRTQRFLRHPQENLDLTGSPIESPLEGFLKDFCDFWMLCNVWDIIYPIFR